MKKLEIVFVLTKRVLGASAVSMALYLFAKCVFVVFFTVQTAMPMTQNKEY